MKPSEIIANLVEHLSYNLNLANVGQVEVQCIIAEWMLDNNITIKEILKEEE